MPPKIGLRNHWANTGASNKTLKQGFWRKPGMDAIKHLPLLESRWDEAVADLLSPEDLLVYRSNLLGGDKRITNFGGGNTSSKLPMQDPLTGEQVSVLWVKGSGGDLEHPAATVLRPFIWTACWPSGNSTKVRRLKTRWSGSIRTAPSTSSPASPASTRRCTGDRAPACRPCAPGRHHRHRRFGR